MYGRSSGPHGPRVTSHIYDTIVAYATDTDTGSADMDTRTIMLADTTVGDVVTYAHPGHPNDGRTVRVESIGPAVGGLGGGGHVFVSDVRTGERFASSRYTIVES